MSESNSPTGSPPRSADELEPGDTIDVTIDEFTNKYLGQAQYDGKTTLVPGTVPGETVRCEILRNWSRKILARPREVLDPDPHRVEPECEHFYECAGCQFQHIDYDHQLTIKTDRLEDFFDRHDQGLGRPEYDVVPSRSSYGYRNQINLHGPGEPGFWKVAGYEMLHNEECPVCVEEIEAALRDHRADRFREFLDDEVENVLFRASSTGDLYVGPENRQLLEEDEWITERLDHPITGEELEYRVPAHGFWQGSQPMLEPLVEAAVEPIYDSGPELLIDAYCGSGLFSLAGAGAVDRVQGIEEDPDSLRAARRNARLQGVEGSRFLQGDTAEELPHLLRQANRENTVLIVDPPRDGLRKTVMKTMLNQPVRDLVYVSCNPDSLARNLNNLCRTTYALDSMVVLDLFPHTKHLECVAHLSRQS